jgi:uncharacterized repeat protein (TIGR01451 family)
LFTHSIKTAYIKALLLACLALLYASSAQAAIVYTGSSSGANDALPTNMTAGTLTIAKPAGTVAGQALIATIAARPQNLTVTVPSGWTQMTVTQQTNGGTLTIPGGMTLLTYYRIVGTSEPTSYSWTFANTAGSGASYGGSAVGGILAFSGIDTSSGSPINVWSQKLTPNGLTHSTTSITPTVTNTMLVSSISYLSGGSFAAPTGIAGLVERLDQSAPAGSSGVGTTLQMATAPWTTATATGSSQAIAANDADTGVGHLMALKASLIDPAITMTLNTALAAGGTGSYTLTIINNGLNAEPGPITVTNTLPAGLTYNATGSGGSTWACSAVGQIVTCTRNAALAGGASAPAITINVNVSSTATGSITNSATVSGTGGDGNTANNTAVDTYTFPTVANFECLETGLTYNNLISSPASRNPLYTKVSGTNFKFDIVAMQANGAISTTYTASSNVTVELFDDSATPQPACSAYASPVASQAITFATTNAGRKTLSANFNIANAYRKLRCRVRDNNRSPVVYGCSSDDFAMRPSNFTVSSSANADNAGSSTSATPIIKAGANFSLTAASGVSGYDGTPSIDASKLAAHAGAAQTGALTGSFNAASSGTGSATGAAFNYGEVGYFRFGANGVYDSTFTAVDSALGDCASGFNASGSLNACNFGNAATSNYFGRFIPDHFALTAGALTNGCGSQFTYFGQDGLTTEFTLTAQNTTNASTQNYAAGFAKLGLGNWTNYTFSASGLPAGANLSASSTAPAGAWILGSGAVSAKHQISRPASATSPASITIRAKPTDSDGVTIPTATAVSTASNVRYGRLWMPNAYGSELLPLSIPLEAQYWNGASYIRNQQDNCSIVPASSIAMSNYNNNLAACETQIGYSSGTGALVNGVSQYLRLTKPGAGNHGSVDLSVNLSGASGLFTCNSAAQSSATAANLPWFGSSNTASRATFGIFKTPVIYLRENFF